MEATKKRKTAPKIELKSRLKNGRLVTDNEYRYRVLVGIGLAVLVAAYTLLYATRVYTLSNGWACTYFSLMQEGKVPYRDFYYYLPPGNLLINWLLYAPAGKYMIIPVYLRILERVFLCEMLYVMVEKRTTPILGALSSFVSMVLASSAVTELGGDYNQTTYLTLVLLLAFFLKYLDHIEESIRKKFGWLIGIGACGGFMLLIKQTIVVSTFVVFLLFISFLFLVNKEKNYLTACILVAFGAALIVLPFVLYLVMNDAFTPFIQQVFADTSAKGDTKTLLTGHFVTFFKENIERILIIGSLVTAYAVRKPSTSKKSHPKLRFGLAVFFVLLAMALFAHGMYDIFWKGIKVTVTSLFVIPLLGAAAALILTNACQKKYALWTFLTFCGMIWVMIFNVNDMTTQLYEETSWFTMLRTLVGYAFLAVLVWLIYHVIVGLCHKKQFALDKMAFACAGLAAAGATLINNGVDDISVGCAYLLVPALTVIVFKNMEITSCRARTYTKVFAVVVLCVLCASVSQKLVKPYSWWGYTAEPFWTKTETSSLPELKGYKLSETDIDLYDELTEVIRDNTDEDSVIFGFPYVKCYNVLLHNYNMDNFVPVLFYDTCADKYAREDAALLAENEPDIVVWLDIENCMETHEKLFRGGNALGQRQIQKWFSNCVKNNKYECIGQVENVFVYKLVKDGQEVGKTYIQRPTRPNKTSKYKLKGTKPTLQLEGEGTEKKPYLISDAEDLCYFRDVVNTGLIDLKDVWLRQTADIDLGDTSNWKPIGIYNGKYYFNGIYDGDGYTIRNLNIEDSKKNVGLFGVLNGTVMNLNVVDCDIIGGCVGGITSHGSGKIYNCYVSGTLSASSRAGGIADNANSQIYNCVAEVELKGDGWLFGVSGYYTNDVKNCFSNHGDEVCVDDGKPLTDDTLDALNAFKFDREVHGINKWVKDKDGNLRVGHDKRK